MRFRRTFVVGLSVFVATICTLEHQNSTTMAALVAQQAATADPFGSDDQASEEPISAKPNADHGTVLQRQNPNERIRQLLRSTTSLEFDEIPWSDIERELEDRYGFNIVLSQSARDDSISADEPFSVNLRGVSLGNALRLMLKEKHATHVVRDEALIIISVNDREDPQYFSRRIIDVTELLRAANLWLQRDEANLSQAINSSMGMGMDMGGNRGGGSSAHHASEASLAELVLQSVQPDAWRSNPYATTGRGKQQPAATGLATCTPFCGRLIVNGPEQLLDEVNDFLREIEASLSVE